MNINQKASTPAKNSYPTHLIAQFVNVCFLGPYIAPFLAFEIHPPVTPAIGLCMILENGPYMTLEIGLCVTLEQSLLF